MGCARKQPQEAAETEMGYRIIGLLKQHESVHAALPITNLGQLYTALEKPYPYSWDEKFRGFRGTAGFTNSIYEKYAFLAPGTKHTAIAGDWVLINAEPFPDRHGQPTRILITRIGTEQDWYRLNRLKEQRVREVFNEAGVALPQLSRMPRPPPAPPHAEESIPSHSLSTKARMFLDDIAEKIGLGKGHWPTVLFLLVLIAILSGTFVFIWISKRRRH